MKYTYKIKDEATGEKQSKTFDSVIEKGNVTTTFTMQQIVDHYKMLKRQLEDNEIKIITQKELVKLAKRLSKKAHAELTPAQQKIASQLDSFEKVCEGTEESQKQILEQLKSYEKESIEIAECLNLDKAQVMQALGLK